MILALLAGAADPQFDRLFGPEPAVAETPAPSPVEPRFPAWMGPFVLGGLGLAAWLWKSQPHKQAPADTLSVLARQSVGDRSNLVLVEVTGADGERRRLLVGTGGGTPTLVADLGQKFEVADEAPRVEVPIAAAPARVTASKTNVAEEVLAERRTRGGRVWAIVGEDE